MIRTKFMRISNKITCVFFIGLLFFAFAGCSNAAASASGTESMPSGSGGGTVTRTEVSGKIGKYVAPYEVGDIVFNDGSAMPYDDFSALDEDTENEKKNSAIALIFYKGTGLNSDTLDENYNITASDNSTVRTLGVGLKHYKSVWCSRSADAYLKNITTIQCPTSGALTFKGDKDGSDNFEQIEAFDGVSDTTGYGEFNRYTAFYFAKRYKHVVNNLGTTYEGGWYIPSIAELFFIYANGKGTNKKFDIDAASQALGGDQFGTGGNQYGTSYYWSSSQFNLTDTMACKLDFEDGIQLNANKSEDICVCAIREF